MVEAMSPMKILAPIPMKGSIAASMIQPAIEAISAAAIDGTSQCAPYFAVVWIN